MLGQMIFRTIVVNLVSIGVQTAVKSMDTPQKPYDPCDLESVHERADKINERRK